MSRPLDKQERILARHLLQMLSEHAKLVRNAMDPLHGMHTITVEAWREQWDALTSDLDHFTEQVKE